MGVATATLEARWFQPGRLPEHVSDWFLQAQFPVSTESRTDLYLDLPGRLDMGVKLRAGSLLEVKVRTGVHTEPGLPEGFEGRVESWTKWGFSLHQTESTPGGGQRDWISAAKTRLSRFHTVASDEGSIRAVASAELPADNGCTAELVEVRVGAAVAWGLGFEAFGTAPDLLRVLVAGMNACVADTPLGALEFAIRDSHSYPAFLSQWPPR